MPVHFDFILSDEDAENLFDILNTAKTDCLNKALLNERYAAAYRKHAAYIDKLKRKLKVTR